MNPMSRRLAASAVLVLAAGAVWAQSATPPAGAASTPRVDQRQQNQAARAAAGASSGQLTPREQRRLAREQKAIGKVEDKAKADGTVTPRERRRLERMQDRASRDTYRQKHDRQRAASAPK